LKKEDLLKYLSESMEKTFEVMKWQQKDSILIEVLKHRIELMVGAESTAVEILLSMFAEETHNRIWIDESGNIHNLKGQL